ncbi:dienelactone hydrolase family protein [Sphingomonas koreensis]|nr:dienelactone hydrolase family protein [Sphingomonas koreensis]
MPHEQISIRTNDGECPTHVFTPAAGDGPWPATIIYMDALAIRPTLFDMGQRLADHGFVVLLPDLFYRAGPYAPLVPKEVFASPDVRKVLGPLMSSTDATRAAEDTKALLAYLDSRDDVAGEKVGVTGYCMGGGIALTVAATYTDRIAAAASFHGGNLATDDATSPHRLAPQIKARVYVAGADQDAHYPPEMADRLDAALTEAGVDHQCLVYPGALHGWTMKDVPVYNEEAAERHWRELFKLFDETLR